ncbi:MAG TPA: hypothetical protein PK174_00650 [Anaerolineaceae bacterium]|nr:hypothetical protein [Anaerolineaceae bacterium]HQP08816.1 hypothetical protein [Anaerolineaceae bacterium]
MSNLCENNITVVGGTLEQRQALIDHAKSTEDLERDFDFNKIIPYPEEYAKADEANKKYIMREVSLAKNAQ